MNSSDFIHKMAALGHQFSFVVAGGGIGLFDLFRVPGCSKVMGEGRVLYNKDSFVNFMILAPNKYVCEETARNMVKQMSCYQPGHVCAAVTAALKTDRERKGKDKACIAIKYSKGTEIFETEFDSTATREQQDAYLTNEILEFIMEVLANEASHA